MKKMKKIASILLTLAMMSTMFSVVFASGNLPTITSPNISEARTAVSLVLGLVQWIGYAFAVGMLIYIGIKYMMASANEKADLKKGSINYVIGAVLVAAAATIAGWIADFGETEIGGGAA